MTTQRRHDPPAEDARAALTSDGTNTAHESSNTNNKIQTPSTASLRPISCFCLEFYPLFIVLNVVIAKKKPLLYYFANRLLT